MKHLRFQLADGSFTSDLYTGGDFIGANDAETEARVIASHKAGLEAAYGVPLVPVVSDTDPAKGKPTKVNPHAAVKQKRIEANAKAEAHEARIQAEIRLMAEERIAAKG